MRAAVSHVLQLKNVWLLGFTLFGVGGCIQGVLGYLPTYLRDIGLFGLTSFVAEQRKKEIGVRKVLGASIFGVWNLLSKEFLLLVFISFMIAVPLAIYFMGDWLKSFTYRTELSWLVFTMAGMGAMGITLLTVSFQAIKAAMANPVNSLRTE